MAGPVESGPGQWRVVRTAAAQPH